MMVDYAKLAIKLPIKLELKTTGENKLGQCGDGGFLLGL